VLDYESSKLKAGEFKGPIKRDRVKAASSKLKGERS